MKIADHFTGKLAICAYDEANEDGVFGEAGCDYAVFDADEYLLKALKDIKEVHSKLSGHFGCDFNKANIELIEFGFHGQVDFFGENPDKVKSEFFKSILSRPLDFQPVDRVEEDGFDSAMEYRDGVINEYTKDHVRQTEEGDSCSIVYYPGRSDIYFKFNPDYSTCYRSFEIDLDELIKYLEDNLNK